MDYYQKLFDIIKQKNFLSENFFEITKSMLDIEQDNFYTENIQEEISKRNDIIEEVNSLDKDFIEIFNDLKKDKDFEENINKYPEFTKYIASIKENFKKSYELDQEISAIMDKQYKEICKDIKVNKEKRNSVDRYAKSSIENITGSNFGIFLDEKK